ncbi:Flp family type IVb pilin [Phenylobacterium sp.]|nr:Flp family type IVb pilin [Phenylobacterium sp.]HEX2558853.1 Flp family type IVb pilin [Phenylobacterium sp.]
MADRSGATAIEYGLIAALIAVACIGGLIAFGDALLAWYQNIQQGVANA